MTNSSRRFLFSLMLLPIGFWIFLGCSPPDKRKQPAQPAAVEIKVVDLAVEKARLPVTASSIKSAGNVWVEVQENLSNGQKKLFLKAAFHEPSEKNLFLESLSPSPVDADAAKTLGQEPADKKLEEGEPGGGHDHGADSSPNPH